MRRTLFCILVLAAAALRIAPADAQGYPPGGGMGRGPITGAPPNDQEIAPQPVVDKPDKAAAKAYAGGMKSLAKAREYEEIALKSTDPDKKAKALEKLPDIYGKALDQFTEVLRNQDMYDAWNQVGYVHLRFAAYRESIDDYNHALALKPDLYEAIHHRGQAYLGVDRLEDAKAAYMELFFHARPMADQLMLSMQDWLRRHRAEANGMRASDIESFGNWLTEREGIAKATAAN
jgi:tetratricopeptide (TPR) repeat protein